MIAKTRGIVIKTIKYTDHSIIARIFTEQFGLRAYLVRGIHSKKPAIHKNSLRPLNILRLTVTEKLKSNFQSIREIEQVYLYGSIPYDIRKECIAMFINELLHKTIHQEAGDPHLFQFLVSSLIQLDEAREGYENFHLQFMLDLTAFLGFAPRDNYSEINCMFDLQEGIFISEPPGHNHWLDCNLSYRLHHLIRRSEEKSKILTSSFTRNELLLKLIEYYQLHIPGLGEFKSPRLLHEILA